MNGFQKLIAKILIPKGYYCHNPNNHNDTCPFWSIDLSKPYQMSGYCSYLGKGDWDFYNEMPKQFKVSKRQPDGSYKETLIKKEPMFYDSIIWDKVKSC